MVRWKTAIAGLAAGIANGLLGAGGGMILIPLLHSTGEFEESEIFPASVAIILPLCVVSLSVNALQQPLPWSAAIPYLLGAMPGGIAAGLLGRRFSIKWMHRLLGVMILWGGIRYLWS